MRKSRFVLLLAGLSVSLFISAANLGASFNAMAEAVAEDVGRILQVVEGDPQRMIFVFEERHDSILLQVEMAIMLDRLYAGYGMRHIGREALGADEGPLDLSWAHTPLITGTKRKTVAKKTVAFHVLIASHSFPESLFRVSGPEKNPRTDSSRSGDFPFYPRNQQANRVREG